MSDLAHPATNPGYYGRKGEEDRLNERGGYVTMGNSFEEGDPDESVANKFKGHNYQPKYFTPQYMSDGKMHGPGELPDAPGPPNKQGILSPDQPNNRRRRQ